MTAATMEIEEGEFVRTKRGIAKVLEVKTVQPKMYGRHDKAYLIDKCPRMYITETEFIKHSKNIIDLIEIYDYVNGMIVFDIITYDNGEKELKLSSGYLMGEDEIQDILTKEQYQANCYTVERKEK